MSYVRPRFRVAPSALAWILGGLVLMLTAAAVPLAAPGHQVALNNVGTEALTVLVYGSAGAVIARRRPRNPIGWIMLVFVVLLMLGTDGGYYAVLHYRLGRRLPLAPVAVLLDPLWVPAVALFPLVILLFPDGRLPSRRWRWVLGAYLLLADGVLAAILTQTISAVVSHHIRLDSFGDVVSSGRQRAAGQIALVLVVAAIGMIVLSFLAHQVLSWRRAAGERRQQLKWLACGGATTVAAYLLGATLGSDLIGQLAVIGLVGLPVSIGVGILKYRLYDIDRIISRTLAYALVTGTLVGLYAGLVLLATHVLGVHSSVAVAASTLVAAALFNPLRLRVQRAVDRRFNRARYDADRIVAAFAARLQDAIDLDSVRDDLAGVVQQALEPAHVSMWMSGHR